MVLGDDIDGRGAPVHALERETRLERRGPAQRPLRVIGRIRAISALLACTGLPACHWIDRLPVARRARGLRGGGHCGFFEIFLPLFHIEQPQMKY